MTLLKPSTAHQPHISERPHDAVCSMSTSNRRTGGCLEALFSHFSSLCCYAASYRLRDGRGVLHELVDGLCWRGKYCFQIIESSIWRQAQTYSLNHKESREQRRYLKACRIGWKLKICVTVYSTQVSHLHSKYLRGSSRPRQAVWHPKVSSG